MSATQPRKGRPEGRPLLDLESGESYFHVAPARAASANNMTIGSASSKLTTYLRITFSFRPRLLLSCVSEPRLGMALGRFRWHFHDIALSGRQGGDAGGRTRSTNKGVLDRDGKPEVGWGGGMEEEIRRERSKSRRAKELGLHVFGNKSRAGRLRGSARMEGAAIGLLTSPLWFPLTQGEGFQLPTGSEWIEYLVVMAGGALMLYWYRNPRARAVAADTRTHRPWIDRVETADGPRFQGMCDCDWRGGLTTRERSAVIEAHRHVSRRHWPTWMGRFGGS